MNLFFKNLGYKIKNNIFIILLFLFSTFFFISQHRFSLPWDFSAYVLNARYLFYGGTYFEVYRAPMASLILSIFIIIGSFGEYLYILFVAGLFLYGNTKLSDVIFRKYNEKEKSNKYLTRFIFYFFSLNPFVVLNGTWAGTELLALAFFEIFLALLISKKISGHFLAFAALTRYNLLMFFPFLLFSRNYKRVLKNVGLFFVIIFPWLLFNYLRFGNFFASIVDSYALNIYFRMDRFEAFNFWAIPEVIGWFLPFLILGIVVSIIRCYSSGKNFFKSNKFIFLFVLIAILIVWDYSKTPFKITRYLFNLTLPIAFFSTIGALFIISISPKSKRFFIILFTIMLLITVNGLFVGFNYTKNLDDKFINAAGDIKTLGIQDCSILSPHWVLVTYFTENVYPLVETSIEDATKKGEIILIFKGDPTMDDNFNQDELVNYNKFYEAKEYMFIADKNTSNKNCAKRYLYDAPMLTNPCEIVSIKFRKIGLESFVLNFCNFINP
jgi:hypothetical protein